MPLVLVQNPPVLLLGVYSFLVMGTGARGLVNRVGMHLRIGDKGQRWDVLMVLYTFFDPIHPLQIRYTSKSLLHRPTSPIRNPSAVDTVYLISLLLTRVLALCRHHNPYRISTWGMV